MKSSDSSGGNAPGTAYPKKRHQVAWLGVAPYSTMYLYPTKDAGKANSLEMAVLKKRRVRFAEVKSIFQNSACTPNES
jgi:hypothetical protein